MRYLLDTHTWVWWNSEPDRLSKKVKTLISDSTNYEELLLSAISPWEFSKLLEEGRLRVSVNGDVWLREALDMPNLRLVPLSPEIAWHSTTLPGEFNEDPADQIIVATARLEKAVIMTCDQTIRKYDHIESVW